MLIDLFTVGPLQVLIDAESGAVLAVQDKLTGAAAALMYSQGAIRHATAQALIAWQSVAELA